MIKKYILFVLFAAGFQFFDTFILCAPGDIGGNAQHAVVTHTMQKATSEVSPQNHCRTKGKRKRLGKLYRYLGPVIGSSMIYCFWPKTFGLAYRPLVMLAPIFGAIILQMLNSCSCENSTQQD